MRTLVFFCCLLSLTAGCADAKQGAKAGSPPLEFSFRRSEIPTRGMVVGIKNASQNETLRGLAIEVRSPDEETARSHLIEKEIKPRDSITVGWVELDGWTLKPGDEVSVTSDNYTDRKAVTVPEPSSAAVTTHAVYVLLECRELFTDLGVLAGRSPVGKNFGGGMGLV